ncbi:MAG: glycosyltransferase family 2 protein [Chloroflexi bacterium]|nr:glycosyltransferase family 2 protein [Chloroflexota bacterium]
MDWKTDTDIRKVSESVSVFFPAYNDGGTIASMVISADTVLRTYTTDYEIIVVNDGSSDYTQEMLDELETKYDRLRIVKHVKNRGYGGAIRSGLSSATKDLVFYTDGDAQYDPHEIVLLFGALRDGVDVVNGYKISRNDPLHRIIIGRLYHWTVRTAFGLNLKDVDCDFRLIRRSVLDRVQLISNSGVICVEMMKKIQDAGFVIEQVPVHHFHRAYGISQFFNFRRVFKTLVDLTRLWFELVLFKKQPSAEPSPCETAPQAGIEGVGRISGR